MEKQLLLYKDDNLIYEVKSEEDKVSLEIKETYTQRRFKCGEVVSDGNGYKINIDGKRISLDYSEARELLTLLGLIGEKVEYKLFSELKS